MTAQIIRMVNSKESEQNTRFQWRETFNGYNVVDTETGETKGMGDGVEMFCPDPDDETDELCFTPGTARFYDALNAYFLGEQAEIAEVHFGIKGYEVLEELRGGGR